MSARRVGSGRRAVERRRHRVEQREQSSSYWASRGITARAPASADVLRALFGVCHRCSCCGDVIELEVVGHLHMVGVEGVDRFVFCCECFAAVGAAVRLP